MSPRRAGNASHPSRSGNRPLYAIDFTAVACGKRIANTKRRVRWRFGFANPDALAAGETGTACRGEEHDITLVWSITSGKRLILADGQEVHYSNSRSAVIDFSWTMRGNHVLKVVAHASAPMSADPGFRQYDFFVDGRSFFSFPKVYRLGLSGSKTVSHDSRERRPERGGGYPAIEHSGSSSRRKESDIAQIEAPHNPDEEEAYLREAIKASLETENARKSKGENTLEKPKISAEATNLLIDFMDDFDATGNTLSQAPVNNEFALAPAGTQSNQWATPAPDNSWAMAPAQTPVAAPAPQPTYDQFSGSGNFAAAPANPFAAAPAQQNFAMPAPAPPTQQNFAIPAPPPPAQQNFAMPASAVDPFASPAFGQPQVPASTAAAPAYSHDPFSPSGNAPAPSADPFAPKPPASAPVPTPAPATTTNAPAPVLTMKSLSGADGLLGQTTTSPTNGGTMADKALENLMGSINSFGLTGSAAKPPDRKNPFDSNNIMSNTTLGEMKAKSTAAGEKKPVMNAAPNALVVAGNQSGNWGGYGQPNMGGSMGGSMMQPQGYQQYPMAGGYSQQPQQPQMGYGGQTGMGMGMGQQPMQQQQYGGYGAPGAPQYQQQQQPPQWGAPSYQ
mmetsp:Transcript_32576/g.66488  ORF Transcript_32576/g.66488 Transcript_32576/m.66488 type:complete len:618 (+) Transcript_32576:280-2133(+)